MKRTIIHIDEEKCDGCGLCIKACPEGALQLIDGKARLVSESYCDGLGACIGECPRGAITFETRETQPFDLEAVERKMGAAGHAQHGSPPPVERASACPSGTCPGSRFLQFPAAETAGADADRPSSHETPPKESAPATSHLTHWPVQLHLVPVSAPVWQNADILVAADCTAAACPDFHRRLLAGKRVIIACPNLDDAGGYVQKLAAIFAENAVRSVTVAHMEVPCCSGLVTLVRQALELSGRTLPFHVLEVDIQGGGVHASPSASPEPHGNYVTPSVNAGTGP